MSFAGGWSESREPNDEEKAVAYKVKDQFVTQSGTNPSKFEPTRVCSAVVAGAKYWFEMDTGDGSYAHIEVFEPLPYTNEEPKLTSFELNKKKGDKLGNF